MPDGASGLHADGGTLVPVPQDGHRPPASASMRYVPASSFHPTAPWRQLSPTGWAPTEKPLSAPVGAHPVSDLPAAGRPSARIPSPESRALLQRRQHAADHARSEEHTSELQSLMRNSYAVFCLKQQ